MTLVSDRCESELGKRLCDTNDGFELANSDGNRRANVGCLLGLCDAVADRDEVRGELLGGIS